MFYPCKRGPPSKPFGKWVISKILQSHRILRKMWALAQADRDKYKNIFDGLSPSNGKLAGDQVRPGK